ncbi:unnamed protein product [Urochloa humidicola]
MDQQNYNIFVWNVRGLNARCRRDNLRELLAACNASVVCLQETKLSVISPFLVNEMLGHRFSSFAYLPSNGASGGILIAARSPEISCTVVHAGAFSVTVALNGEHQAPWSLTGVYGPQADVDKVEFLNELRATRLRASPNWMITEDFNLLLDASDKNNANVNRRNLGRFRRFVDELQLKSLPAPGTLQLLDWWLLLRAGQHNLKQKGLDSMVMLISWCVWKERNSRTFNSAPERSVAQLASCILEEGYHWTLAGAKHLAAIGWPSPAVVGRATGDSVPV